jgi:hypothetical protein
MSSTTNIQNLLVNVFRPIYTYDTITSNFVPRLELSNIDVVSANSVSVFTAAVGDSASNVYVGSNAGNVYNNVRACCNVTAVGYGAGNLISNVSNSVYFGFNTGAGAVGATNVVAIGANANGDGSGNIFIGSGTGRLGSNNIFLGTGINISNVSDQLRIGSGSNITIAGNLSNNWVGIGGTVTPQDSLNKLDVSGNVYVLGNIGLNITPGDRTLDVNGNFRASDGVSNVLDFSNGVTSSTDGFRSINGTGTVPLGGSLTIGTLKKGVVLVSASDSNGASNYASRMVHAYDNLSTFIITNLGADISAGDFSVGFSTSNIQISNAGIGALAADWSITYFPTA